MDDHREGIQTEKLISRGSYREDIQADKPVPSWKRPGYFRRDCEPHRGDILWEFGCAAFVLGILALVPCLGWVPGLLGIPLGLCCRYLAKADLAKIRMGLMDPTGEAVTYSAEELSTCGLVYSVAGTVVWGGMILVVWWIPDYPPM
jgi:hypothetical protein